MRTFEAEYPVVRNSAVHILHRWAARSVENLVLNYRQETKFSDGGIEFGASASNSSSYVACALYVNESARHDLISVEYALYDCSFNSTSKNGSD